MAAWHWLHASYVALAGEGGDAVIVAALSTLTRLAQQSRHCRDAVRLAGGVSVITGILAACSSRLEAAGEAAACLGAVATENLENQVRAAHLTCKQCRNPNTMDSRCQIQMQL